jgi:hypothetical protein
MLLAVVASLSTKHFVAQHIVKLEVVERLASFTKPVTKTSQGVPERETSSNMLLCMSFTTLANARQRESKSTTTYAYARP